GQSRLILEIGNTKYIDIDGIPSNNISVWETRATIHRFPSQITPYVRLFFYSGNGLSSISDGITTPGFTSHNFGATSGNINQDFTIRLRGQTGMGHHMFNVTYYPSP
ncbi:MAG: hypothetical protein AABY22_29050, partial [Nanoarchaeota archaeon]